MKVGDTVKVKRLGEERLGTVMKIIEPCIADKEYRCLVDFSTHTNEYLSLMYRFYWYDFSKVLEVINERNDK